MEKACSCRCRTGGHTPTPGVRAWLRLFPAIPTSFPILVVAILCLASSPAQGSSDSSGLDLQSPSKTLFTLIEIDPAIGDPHDMECDGCHAEAGKGTEKKPLKFGDDSVRLCLECHPDGNLHPVGIPLAEQMTPPEGIPLGEGSLEGRITCVTCHYIHARKHERYILRAANDAGERRMDTLCSACHSDRLKTKSPHSSDTGSCHLCHMNPPREGEGLQSLGPNVQATCNFCHSAVDNQHYLSVNPFSDEYIMTELLQASIPLLNGHFTCVSCHDPHAIEGRVKLLREDYLMLAGISKKINPHWKNVMCISCHEGEPRKDSARLKEGGDLVRLCYRCHAFKYSRQEIHPFNMAPSPYVTIPDDMPLKDGRVTCETCHDSSLQEGGERLDSIGKRNPKFLRGGFVSRKEFCFRCHSQNVIRLLNAHDQIDSQGSKKLLMCLFCHSSVPDENSAAMYLLQFAEDSVNDLCFLCHTAYYRENHPIAPHLVTPSDEILQLIETAEDRLSVTFPLFDEKIVCITCHNPHQEGVIRDKMAAKGSSSQKRLRSPKGLNICNGCHLSK